MPTRIRLPFEFVPRPYQRPFFAAMEAGKLRAVLVHHRRAGKDKTMLNYMVKEMWKRVGTYHYVFPEYNQGRKVLWDGIDRDGFRFMDHIPQIIRKDTNHTEMKITLKNGSVFQIVGSDKMDNIVGTNPIGIAFSEYPLQKTNVWDYYRPILAENGGWAIFGFTPRGMNHGWKILQQARENRDSWFSEVLTVDDTEVVPVDVLAQEKKEMPAALFRQEYYCEFIEGAGAFFRRVKDNVRTAEGDHGGHIFQIGVDLAKYQDWTVITPFCLTCFQALAQDRFNQVDWNLQKSRIQTAAYKYNNARVIVDATGVGDPIAEDLMNAGIAVEPFKFTETSRRDLLNNLSVMLEQDKIKIPNDEGLTGELLSCVFTMTESGKLKVGVPEGLTDDRIMSLALSVWGATQPVRMSKAAQEEFQVYVQDFS